MHKNHVGVGVLGWRYADRSMNENKALAPLAVKQGEPDEVTNQPIRNRRPDARRRRSCSAQRVCCHTRRSARRISTRKSKRIERGSANGRWLSPASTGVCRSAANFAVYLGRLRSSTRPMRRCSVRSFYQSNGSAQNEALCIAATGKPLRCRLRVGSCLAHDASAAGFRLKPFRSAAVQPMCTSLDDVHLFALSCTEQYPTPRLPIDRALRKRN